MRLVAAGVFCTALFSVMFFALPVHAHEVYVLDPVTIASDIQNPSPNPFAAFWTNKFQFFFWTFIAFVLVTTVFFASITHRLEVTFRSSLVRLKPYAAPVARITLGLCLIACAWYGGLFGPELPLADFAGKFRPLVDVVLYGSGALIVVGLWTRFAAALALVIFLFSAARYGIYMLTYSNYLGEIIAMLVLGGGIWALDGKRRKKKATEDLELYAFLALRVLFGLSLIFASVYAKFIHSQLALDVVTKYDLVNYFPFEPLFIVLGAGIIEFLAGVFIIIGFEIRHTALFLLFWITASLLFFQESVWPHLVLVGVLVALFMRGYDRYTVEGRFWGTGGREPVL